MQSNSKEWLVRTRTGEVLGPFTQRELMEEFQRNTFSVDDEIAPSLGHWVSAQGLGTRDAEEFTHTATRSQAFTRSIHTKSQTVSPPTPGPASTVGPIDLTGGDEELTPTPPDFERPMVPQFPRGPELPPLRRARIARPARSTSRLAPFATLLFIVIAALALVSQMKTRTQNGGNGTLTPKDAPVTLTGDSPFVKHIEEMIYRGEFRAALAQLTTHHEKNAGRGDIDYLLPYASLLIMEGEAPARAKKFLEQILNSNAPGPLKAQAHHWMGYLLLSLNEGDLGESHFLDSLQLNTKDAASRFNLGRIYLVQNKFSPALDYFQLSELERPDLWIIHIYKGFARAEMGNNEEARASFLKAIALSPDRWMSYMYYTVFQLRLSEVEGAQKTIRLMLTRDPKYEINSPPPWGFFQERINYAEYLSTYNSAMARIAGEEKEIGKLYLSYLMNNGQGNEGAKIETIADKGGLMAKVLALKVVLDRDATADEIRLAANRLPPLLSDFGYYAYVLRGEAKLRLGNLSDAQADIKRALDLEPKSALANFSMAVLFKRMQRIDEAQSQMRDLLSRHPGYIPAILLSRPQ